MSGSTPELNLATAEGPDDSRQYLIVGLGNALTTLDSLFNSVSGHNHAGAHQGGPLAPNSIQPPIDIPGMFRSTNNTGLPSTGAGLEMYYDTTGPQGVLQAYDRDAATARSLGLSGSEIRLITGGVARLTVGADAHIRLGESSQIYFSNGANLYGYGNDGAGHELVGITGGLTVTPGPTYLAGLQLNGSGAVTGNLLVTGTVTVGALALASGSLSVPLDITAGRNTNFAGNTTTGSLNVSGNSVVNGNLTAGSLNSNGALVAGTGVWANGGNVYFEGSGQVRITWNAAQARLDVPYGNGLWAAHVVAAGGVTGLGGVVGGTVGCYGANGQFQVRPGRAEVTCYYSPSLAVALALNALDHHDHILFVQGGAMGTSGWEVLSSARYKDNLALIEPRDALGLVANPDLHAWHFYHTLDEHERVGFVAEEWAEALPEAVSRNADGEPDGMSYEAVTPILFAALKELLARVEALEAA